MDARTFLKKKPEALVERVAVKAGTTLAYFKQLAYGARTPGKKLAGELEEASGGVLTRMELLYPPKPDARDTTVARANP